MLIRLWFHCVCNQTNRQDRVIWGYAERDGNYRSCRLSALLRFYTTVKKKRRKKRKNREKRKESASPNLPSNHTDISPGTYMQSESLNNPYSPSTSQTEPLRYFFPGPWSSIKENIRQILPLVCKWDQDGLKKEGALDSIWGLMNHAVSIRSWKPTGSQMCGAEPGATLNAISSFEPLV